MPAHVEEIVDQLDLGSVSGGRRESPTPWTPDRRPEVKSEKLPQPRARPSRVELRSPEACRHRDTPVFDFGWLDRYVAGVKLQSMPPDMPVPPAKPEAALKRLLGDGVTWGDSSIWLPRLPQRSVDLFFTSPPYADARAYSRVHPDRYVEWFLPFAESMFDAAAPTGSLVVNIKNRVAKDGKLKGQRHPYVYQLVIALQDMGWRWLETYIWAKPNAVPGRFGPRTKDAFEYVYHFARGPKPYFDLDSIRVPYKTTDAEIERRKLDKNGRRNTEAGFGRDRVNTYAHGGADPGNVVQVPQTYNQHYGVAHTAAMPEGLASFFIKAASPPGGIVIDPFAGGGTTSVVARRHGRQSGGLELHEEFVREAHRRLEDNDVIELPGTLSAAL